MRSKPCSSTRAGQLKRARTNARATRAADTTLTARTRTVCLTSRRCGSLTRAIAYESIRTNVVRVEAFIAVRASTIRTLRQAEHHALTRCIRGLCERRLHEDAIELAALRNTHPRACRETRLNLSEATRECALTHDQGLSTTERCVLQEVELALPREFTQRVRRLALTSAACPRRHRRTRNASAISLHKKTLRRLRTTLRADLNRRKSTREHECSRESEEKAWPRHVAR